MKKLLLLFSLIVVSCGKPNDACQFTKLIENHYNLNSGNIKVISTVRKNGCYNINKYQSHATLSDSKSVFRVYIRTNPNEFEVWKANSKILYGENRGYKLGNSMKGDTLVLQCFPTAATPEAVLKLGFELKFYN